MTAAIRTEEPSGESKELKKKKMEILKRFMNKKILLTMKDSVQQLKKLPFIKVEEMPQVPKFKVGKVGGRHIPDYLKEDFPDKRVHNARAELRQMNDVMPVSPTALEYTAILDTYTLIKGVPALNPHKRKNKKKSPEKSSHTIEIGKIRYNPESSMKEQHQYDLQYKSYFGDESLELHEDSQEALLSELKEEESPPKVPLRHSLSQNIARSPARSRNNNSNNGGRSGGYKTNDAISAEWRQRIDE